MYVSNEQLQMQSLTKSVMVFYEKDRQIISSHRNWPLYVTACVHNVELKLALIDTGSSLNIMLLFTLNKVGIFRSKIVVRPSLLAKSDSTRL